MPVRPVKPEDKDQFMKLYAGYLDFYHMTLSDQVLDKTWGRFFEDSEPMYAAVIYQHSPDQIIGLVTWLYHRSTFCEDYVIYLHDLYVDPDSRLNGLGRALIEHVYQDAEKNGAAKVYWHTQHFNHRAQLLYTKVAQKTDMVQYSRATK